MNIVTDLPSSPSALPFETRLQRLLHEWFVVYNPLYVASALSFLAGVWLASGELALFDWRSGDLALFGIVQLYELCLIGAAALLWRRGAFRPAILLLLLESVFFFDPTGEIESLIHLEPWDLPLGAIWLVFAFLKIRILERIFALRLGGFTWTVLLGSAALIVATPLLIDSFPRSAGGLHPIAFFLGLGLAALSLSGRCRVTFRGGELGPSGRKCFDFVLGAAAALTLLHLFSWLFVFDLELGAHHGRALYALALIWLAARRRFALSLLLAAIPFLPRLAALLIRQLSGFERGELACGLIAAAFLLIAAGLAVNLGRARARNGWEAGPPGG